MKKTGNPIIQYEKSQPPKLGAVCRLIRKEIKSTVPKAVPKLYHAIPVWFVGENAIVGYAVRKDYVNLLFWNGQAFDEPDLEATGKFEAAEIHFRNADEINLKALRRWLKKSEKDIWDFAGLRKSELRK